jgi:O-succinylbenzoic acid--CoA ligase
MAGLPVIRAWLSPSQQDGLLGERVAARASALHAAAERGARFLVLPAQDSPEAAAWILASFYSPVTVVPVPGNLPVPELERRLCQLPEAYIFPAELPADPAGAPVPERKSLQDLWAVVFTSGSSGEPKGIALTGSAFEAGARAHARHSQAPDACWLLDLPLHHIGGLSVLTRAFFLEAPVALGPPGFDAKATASWVRSGIVQGLSLVPTTLFRLLREPELDFSPLRLALLGGAPAEPALIQEALARGMPIRQTYGMTEHASQIATARETGGALEPLPGVELRLGVVAEILVRSRCLARGFFRNGALEELPLQEGYFATGDLGELQGGRLSLTGRKSDLILSGGKKIFPVEVEQALGGVPGLRDCAVTSVPDPEWGEALSAVVVEDFPGSFREEAARSLLAARLECHKLPKRWILAEAIPRSPAGKILRSELRSLAALKSSRS